MLLKYKLEEIEGLLDQIFFDLIDHRIICISGSMGAGKTTLVRAMIRKFASQDKGASPTFGIVNEYHNANGELIAYHFDCYRLESLEEALDLGIEEYLDGDYWVFIEWPEKISDLLPKQRTEMHLRIVDANTRELTIRNLK